MHNVRKKITFVIRIIEFVCHCKNLVRSDECSTSQVSLLSTIDFPVKEQDQLALRKPWELLRPEGSQKLS